MLTELRITDFAIIDHLEINFHRGLNIFTGETGAGKSIIIDAVEALLGSRSDVTQVRAGAERAQVEAEFTIPKALQPTVHGILEGEELMEEPGFITLGREIRRNGRSVARINGHNVSVGMLSQLGGLLVDVHGQSEHLSLLHVSQHLRLLDAYAGLEQELAAYQKTYHSLLALRKSLHELRQAESEAARRIDILTYQINEIEAARLQPAEEDTLRAERTRLANAEGLSSLAQQAIQLLDEGMPEAPSAIDLLGQAVSALGNLSRLDASQASVSEQAQLISESLGELASTLRAYLENIEFNPRRLDQVEERLNLIHTLKRKYGDSIPEILAFAEQARSQLEAITHAGERIAELEADESQLLEQLGLEGSTLSKKRHSAALALESALEAELNSLNMDGAHFQVHFQQRDDPNGIFAADGRQVAFDSNGLEKVEFLVAPNPGEGFKPLVKIASGGETSRLMLAIKNVLAQADQVPTLIFDEIDQGIGGRVGSIVGRKLWDLARQHQVLCVTHLPQLAAYGEQHLRVQKQLKDGRTLTEVASVEGEERMLELAQMMGDINEGTRRSAEELLKGVQNRP